MATWMIATFTKWTTVKDVSEMQVAIDYPSKGHGWADVTGQTDLDIKNRSGNYCALVIGELDDAQLTAFQADTRYIILARWEHVEPGKTPSFDNRDATVTTAQKNAFVTYFADEFGINVAKVPVIANAVGQPRKGVLRDIVSDLRKLK